MAIKTPIPSFWLVSTQKELRIAKQVTGKMVPSDAILESKERGGFMTRVDEIAPDIFRISTYVPDFNLQFNQFLVRDDEPLLFETGMKQMFPLVREAVSKLINPASLRYISFSHYETDECGSMNEWLPLAPRSEA